MKRLRVLRESRISIVCLCGIIDGSCCDITHYIWLNIAFDERKNADFIDLAADAECRRATTVLFYYFNERLSNHLLNLAAVRFLHQIARTFALKIKRGNVINCEKRMKKTITKSRRKIYN